MIIIEHFYPEIEELTAGSDGLLDLFLHQLFPLNFPAPVAKTEQLLLRKGDYQRVAALGFLFYEDERYRRPFKVALYQLRDREHVGNDLLDHLIALYGIALGLLKLDDSSYREWFHKLFFRKDYTTEFKSRNYDFFRSLMEKNLNFPFRPERAEYHLFLQLLLGLPDGNQSGQMQDFFVKYRKAPFPVDAADPFRSLLIVYLLDQCYQLCIWDLEQVAALQRAPLVRIRELIEERAHRQARQLVVVAAILATAGVLVATGAFFRQIALYPGWQEFYRSFESYAYFLGGPLAVILLLIRLLRLARKKAPLKYDLHSLIDRTAHHLERRQKRRWGLLE